MSIVPEYVAARRSSRSILRLRLHFLLHKGQGAKNRLTRRRKRFLAVAPHSVSISPKSDLSFCTLFVTQLFNTAESDSSIGGIELSRPKLSIGKTVCGRLCCPKPSPCSHQSFPKLRTRTRQSPPLFLSQSCRTYLCDAENFNLLSGATFAQSYWSLPFRVFGFWAI